MSEGYLYPENIIRPNELKRTLDSAFEQATRNQEAAKAAQIFAGNRPANEGSGVTDLVYNLTSSAPLKLGKGYGFLFRQLGSAPGARLDINIGGVVSTVYPGTVWRGEFNEGEVARSASSVQTGNALITVFRIPGIDISESNANQINEWEQIWDWPIYSLTETGLHYWMNDGTVVQNGSADDRRLLQPASGYSRYLLEVFVGTITGGAGILRFRPTAGLAGGTRVETQQSDIDLTLSAGNHIAYWEWGGGAHVDTNDSHVRSYIPRQFSIWVNVTSTLTWTATHGIKLGLYGRR